MCPKMQQTLYFSRPPEVKMPRQLVASYRGMGSVKTQTETLWILAQIRGPSIKTHHGRHHNYA